MRLITFVLTLLFLSDFPAQADSTDRTPRFLVHLLGYLAKDYGGAVANGKIISESEYREQVEFSESALETNQGLEETRGTPEIAGKLKTLRSLISTKADAEQVSKLAREIQAQVMLVAQIEVAPLRWPSLRRGNQIFAQNCVACHGASGAGDGPAGQNLDPKPANFLDSRMKEVSPFQTYNTIRLGVPGTGMPPFHSLSDQEAWDVSFYVLSLRYITSARTDSFMPNPDKNLLRLVAISSDDKLKEDLDDKDQNGQAQIIAALRTHSDDDESGGNSLDIARTQLDEAVKDYQSGNSDAARTKALKAYLEGIEPIEPRLKASDPNAVSLIEMRMADVRDAIESKVPLSELQAKVMVAKNAIQTAETLISARQMSPWLAFMAAAAILFREGFEAVLIIIALLGVVRAAGSRKAALWVHCGWTSALGLGLAAWIFSGWLMGISGAGRETLEGATSLFAVVVLLIVGFWLHSQTEIGRWQAFIHGKVQKALEGKNLWALASISFVAVFREAFETVLFLRAVWLEGGGTSKIAMATGVVMSLTLVIAMAWAILKYSARLPIRRLFGASALIMAALALILTGKGLHAFQEVGMLSVTSSPSSFHFDLLGIYPTWETLASQLGVLMLVGILWLYGKRPTSMRTSLGASAES